MVVKSILVGGKVGSHLLTCGIGKEHEVKIISFSATNMGLRKGGPNLHKTGMLGHFDRVNVA